MCVDRVAGRSIPQQQTIQVRHRVPQQGDSAINSHVMFKRKRRHALCAAYHMP